MERRVWKDICVWSDDLNPYFIVNRCVFTRNLVWNVVLRQIFESGALCWDRLLGVVRCGDDSFVWSGVFGPIVECGTVCWYR